MFFVNQSKEMSAKNLLFNSGFRHIVVKIFSYLHDPHDVQNCFKADGRFMQVLWPTINFTHEKFQSWVDAEAEKGNITPFVLMLNTKVVPKEKLSINSIYKRAIQESDLNLVRFIRDAYDKDLIKMSGTHVKHTEWKKKISPEKWHFVMLGIYTACENDSLEILKYLMTKKDNIGPSKILAIINVIN